MQILHVLETLCNLVIDCAEMCSTVGSRDVLEIRNRVQHEGISFITITLPNFGKDFEKCLEQGMESNLFLGWKKRRGLPEFLRGFLYQCFDPNNLRIINDDSISIVVKSVRQICNFCKKIALACSEKRSRAAFSQYKKTDDELCLVTPSSVGDNLLSKYRFISRTIVGRLFHSELDYLSLNFHHGPGGTADKVKGNCKYYPNYVWPESLEKIGLDPSIAYSSEECYNLSDIRTPIIGSSSKRAAVKVIAVPKTLKTPRIIAMEPCAMQFAQQGVKDLIVKTIEAHPWTSGHINFKDQSVNRQLALDNSISRRLATIDLQEASDRVPLWLVEILFEANRYLQELVMTCRSPIARLPDGTRININKYASMGSALCFPVEALHFFVMLVLAGLEHKALECTQDNIRKLVKSYYVYGDDIICPIDEVETIADIFQRFGSVVSKTKSFFRGSFRESCGMDAYAGIDVTPVYMRKPIPDCLDEVSEIISSVETTNQLAKSGFMRAAYYMRKHVEDLLGPLPITSAEFGALGWKFGTLRSDHKLRLRESNRYQRVEVLTWSIQVLWEEDVLMGYPALAKCLHRLEQAPLVKYEWEDTTHFYLRRAVAEDKQHLWRSPRRFGAPITLKRRWVPYETIS